MIDYFVIRRGVYTADNPPEVFIAKPVEIKNKIHKGTNREGQVSYWFQRKDYKKFAGRWKIIGSDDIALEEASSKNNHSSLSPEETEV